MRQATSKLLHVKRPSLPLIKESLFAYASCWEDIDFAMRGLRQSTYKRTLSIASGGDNTLALLTRTEQEVLAVDLSAQQLFLLELKAACIARLTREETISFLGLSHSTIRLETFKRLRSYLSEEACYFWDIHKRQVAAGVLNFGKLDRYFATFQRFILPLIHDKSLAVQILRPKGPEAQQELYETRWNSRRWRALFNVFFSSKIMALLGRDPEKFAHIETSLSEELFKQAGAHLSSTAAQENGFLHYMLVGGFGDYLPWYLREIKYESIKENLHKLRTFHGSLAEVNSEEFDLFNLSNIFEYMDINEVKQNAQLLAKLGTPGAELFYWNMMVPRNLAELVPEAFKSIENLGIRRDDWGFFYRKFHRNTLLKTYTP